MIPPKSLQIVLQRSLGLCEVCGKQGGQTHHRRARGMGGSKDPQTHKPSNLIRLCGSLNVTGNCHAWVESHRTEALNEGLLVRQGQDPREVPVKLSRGWVFLDDDGNYIPVPEVA